MNVQFGFHHYAEGNVSPADNAKLLFFYTDSLSTSDKMFYIIKAILFNKMIPSKNETVNSSSQYIPSIRLRKNIKSLQYSLLNEGN
jgi:hypothetical protein